MRTVLAPDIETCREATATMLELASKVISSSSGGEYEGWAGLDDLFLALEGSALWVQAQMALDHASAGQDRTETLMSLVPFYAFWSQEEGMGLFLLIDRLVPDWKARYFGSEMPSPFDGLRVAVDKPASEKQRGK